MTYSPTVTSAWNTLQQQAESASAERITDFFTENPNRTHEMSVECGELHLDFSKNLVSNQTWQALLALADQSPLETLRAAMFSGETINTTENRAVLHAALRAEIGDQKVASAAEESDQRVSLVKQQLSQVKLSVKKYAVATGLAAPAKR